MKTHSVYMKLTLKKVLLMAGILIFFDIHAQNNQELFIETLSETEAIDIFHEGIDNGSCNAGDIVITIKSLIPDLHFESNVSKLTVSPLKEGGGYIFCHRSGRFILTVNSPNHTSKDILIDGKSTKYAFKISSKAATGKIFFHTVPNNALADFGLANVNLLTDKPIEMNAGEYRVTITKDGYLPVDTTIIVPSDGNMNEIDITLEPVFAKIQFNVTPTDDSQFQIYPDIFLDSILVHLSDLFIDSKTHSFDDPGKIEYFSWYKGGNMPVPAATYTIKITTPGFKPFSHTIQTFTGKTIPVTALLEPETGYLTIVDKGNAYGAKVFINDLEIGTVPMFKRPIRAIGKPQLVRVEKEGYIANYLSSNKNFVNIQKDKEEELQVLMKKYVSYRLLTEPAGADVFVNGNREGFTPMEVLLQEGENKVTISKIDYLDWQQTFSINPYSESKEIELALESTHPFKIRSEEDGLSITIKRKGIIISSDAITPATLLLPYDKYKLELFDDGSKRYSGYFVHSENKNNVKAPSYSKGTFTSLIADYFTGNLKAKTTTDEKNPAYFYNLKYNFQFGRFNLFPGFSTSILRSSMFEVNETYRNKTAIIPKNEEKNLETTYPSVMFSLSCLFLNGEFRMGGSVGTKYVDACFLGTYVFYPKLSEIISISHINGQEIFVGIEIASRIPYLNANIKIGQEIYDGSYNFVVSDQDKPLTYNPFKISNFVLTLGVTLGNSVNKSNNMLRLW